jgi:hypothetical protein
MISIALPTAHPSGASMFVMSASVRIPARVPMETRESASARPSDSVFMKAPSPHFTSSTSASHPSASFLLITEAEMSGTEGTVAVTSRSAYSFLSAGASDSV